MQLYLFYLPMSRMCMQEYKERALFFLEHIPSEHNTIIQEEGLEISRIVLIAVKL